MLAADVPQEFYLQTDAHSDITQVCNLTGLPVGSHLTVMGCGGKHTGTHKCTTARLLVICVRPATSHVNVCPVSMSWAAVWVTNRKLLAMMVMVGPQYTVKVEAHTNRKCTQSLQVRQQAGKCGFRSNLQCYHPDVRILYLKMSLIQEQEKHFFPAL